MTSSCHLINSLGKQEILLIYIAPVARAKENLPLCKSAETDVYSISKSVVLTNRTVKCKHIMTDNIIIYNIDSKTNYT